MENITIENWECAIKDEMKRKYPSDIVFIILYEGNSNSVFIHSHRVVDGNKIATMFFNTDAKELINSLNLGREEIYLAKFENGEFIEKSIWDELIPKEYYEINELVYIYKKYNLKGYFIYCYSEDLDLFNLVKQAGGNPNLIVDGYPSIYSFIETDNIVAVKFLIENGADINTLNKQNRTMLDLIIKLKSYNFS